MSTKPVRYCDKCGCETTHSPQVKIVGSAIVDDTVVDFSSVIEYPLGTTVDVCGEQCADDVVNKAIRKAIAESRSVEPCQAAQAV